MKNNRNVKSISVLQLTVILICVVVGALQAQNTVSPYSIFGPGEIQNRGFGASQGMGGAGIALKSGSKINNLNPASYTGIDSMRIISEFGIEGKAYNLNSSGESQAGFNGNINYMALGFRITPWLSGSLGITPFSNIGYTISKTNYVEGMNSEYTSTYVGSGGISQFYFGNALKINKNLSLGINVSYMFGPLMQEENITATDYVPQLQVVRQDNLKSFYFDYGLQYSFSIKNVDYSFGLTCSNQQNLNSNHAVSVYDDSYTLIQSDEYDTDYLTIPTILGVGIGIKEKGKYEVAFDYTFQNWSEVSFPIQYDDFADAHQFALGMEFNPWGSYRAVNAFYKNWTYRFGLNYNRSYLKFGNSTVNNKSVSLGVGIPLAGRISKMDFSITGGVNGSNSGNLIQEKYLLFNLGFSLNEIAFIKRKFD